MFVLLLLLIIWHRHEREMAASQLSWTAVRYGAVWMSMWCNFSIIRVMWRRGVLFVELPGTSVPHSLHFLSMCVRVCVGVGVCVHGCGCGCVCVCVCVCTYPCNIKNSCQPSLRTSGHLSCWNTLTTTAQRHIRLPTR